MSAQPVATVQVVRWAPTQKTPDIARVAHARDQATEGAARMPDYGPEPRGFQEGVAAALAWVLGEGPQPDGPAWCEVCGGDGDAPYRRSIRGQVWSEECPRCAGRGLEP